MSAHAARRARAPPASVIVAEAVYGTGALALGRHRAALDGRDGEPAFGQVAAALDLDAFPHAASFGPSSFGSLNTSEHAAQ